MAKAKSAAAAKPPAKTTTKAPLAPLGVSSAASKLWAEYCAKPDREVLSVYADALEQGGDPRGAFINLCLLDAPTAEQQAKKEALLGKQKKLLAGPGGEYLREFFFAPDGIVARARTEAAQVIAGIDAIAQLNPRLVLTITSIKTLKDAQAFSQVPLGKIWFVDFGWLTGTHGGMNMSDKQLVAIAPALREVRHLQLSCRGTPDKCFSPDGLRAVAAHLGSLRYLALDYYSVGLPAAEEYARAVEETLPQLGAFDFCLNEGPNSRRSTRTGLLDGGRMSSACSEQVARGRSFVDQLEAALA